MKPTDYVSNLRALLVETVEGPPGESAHYTEPGSGLLQTLDGVTAIEASTPFPASGVTIAAQAEHLRFYLDAVGQFLVGNAAKVDWDLSWKTTTVNDDAWDALRTRIRTTHVAVLELIDGVDDWGDDEVSDTLSILAHTAYHTGVIRLMVKGIRAR